MAPSGLRRAPACAERMDSARYRRVAFLLGLAMLAAAGFLQLQSSGSTPGDGSATVQLQVVGPNGSTLHDASVAISAGETTALGALRSAADAGHFELETYEYPGLGTMVVSIFGHHNEGSCGWVYSVDGTDGDRAASDAQVRTGQTVRWGWSCHS